MTAECPYHANEPAAERCAGCGRGFCDSCVVEFMGELQCESCKLERVLDLQRPKLADPRRVVFWARVFDWVLAVPSLFWGAISLSLLFRPGGLAEPIEIYAAVSVTGMVLYLPPALFLGQERPWAYRYQMVTLTVGVFASVFCFSCFSILLFPPAVVLWSYLQRSEVRGWCEYGY